MKFKETLMWGMLNTPKDEYLKGGVYRVLLLIPYLLIVLTFGIFIALCVDFWVANLEGN